MMLARILTHLLKMKLVRIHWPNLNTKKPHNPLIILVEHISEKPHDADDEITNWFIIKRCYPEIYAVFTTLLGLRRIYHPLVFAH